MKNQRHLYGKLKQLHDEVKNHADLSYKSIPYFVKTIKEIKVELLKVASAEGEQISREVTDGIRHINITEMEDLSNIQSYPKEIPKYLGRVKTAILYSLSFASR